MVQAQKVVCPQCKQELDRSCFNADRNRKNGLYPYCKPCRRLRDQTPAGRHSGQIRRANRRAREKALNVQNTLTKAEWELIIALQWNTCLGCHRKFSQQNPPTKDHYIPLSQGGALDFQNTYALCRSCNSRKCDRMISYQELYKEAQQYAAAD